MRLYRGLTKDDKMVYGWYCYVQKKHYIILPDAFISTHNGIHSYIEVKPKTVGQSTGFKDKNGKAIYFDSDIVEYTYIIENDIETSEKTIRGTVILDLGFTNSLCVKTKGGLSHHFTASESRYFEVIGNVHQDPELLEKAK